MFIDDVTNILRF